MIDLGFHPLAAHAVLGQHEQQFVVVPDGLLDLFVELAATLDVFRREPAAHAPGLQVGMKPFGKLLILTGIADETRVELDGPPDQRPHVRDELIRHAGPTQEDLGNPALRGVDGVDADRRRATMCHRFQPLRHTQIHGAEHRPTHFASAEVRPA